MKYNVGDKIVLSKGYSKSVINNDYWTIPLSILGKTHTIKEVYINKSNETWIYFGEKDINGKRIYVQETEIEKNS
jgi:hypothetical protein